MKTLVLAVVIVALVPTPARAQWTNPYTGSTWNNPISSSLDTMILHSMQRKMLEQSIAAQGKSGAASNTTPVKVRHKPAGASDFKPGKGRPVVDAFLTSSGLDAEQQKVLKQVIDATFVEVGKQLRKNNVATGMGFVIGVSIEIVHGKELSDADGKELIAGINDLLAANKDFLKLKAKDKQALYDAMVMSGALLITFHAAGEADPKMKETSVDMAKSLLAQLTGSQTAN